MDEKFIKKLLSKFEESYDIPKNVASIVEMIVSDTARPQQLAMNDNTNIALHETRAPQPLAQESLRSTRLAPRSRQESLPQILPQKDSKLS